VHELSRQDARRIAVRAQLLDRARPDGLLDVEMYKPAAKRRWGYFALPILHADRFVGKSIVRSPTSPAGSGSSSFAAPDCTVSDCAA